MLFRPAPSVALHVRSCMRIWRFLRGSNPARDYGLRRPSFIADARDLGEYGWKGILSAVRQAMRSTVHTTTQATPSQLVFNRDTILNTSFEADWQYIKERKQRLILQNNRRKNAKRIAHTHNVGDRVMIHLDPNRKHGEPLYKGPYTVTQVYDNGTVKLSRATPAGGAVSQTWNIRNICPCMD